MWKKEHHDNIFGKIYFIGYPFITAPKPGQCSHIGAFSFVTPSELVSRPDGLNGIVMGGFEYLFDSSIPGILLCRGVCYLFFFFNFFFSTVFVF